LSQSTLEQFLRYNVVGVANTLVGVGIIFALMLCGLSPTKSNFIGYVIGAILSYYLNSRYTFKDHQKELSQALKFFAALSVAYALNYLTLQYTLTFLDPYFSQILSAIVYTLSSFIMIHGFIYNK
jgi:putative flippase GtrA